MSELFKNIFYFFPTILRPENYLLFFVKLLQFSFMYVFKNNDDNRHFMNLLEEGENAALSPRHAAASRSYSQHSL